MLKHSPSRNQGIKGFKVKHAIQIFLMLAICIWLVYQLKHSNDEKALEESSVKISAKVHNEHGVIIELGRRGLHPRLEEASSDIGSDKENIEEEPEEVVDETKAKEGEEEGRGSVIDVHDLEGVDDMIDEDDTEREEENEEQERDKENDMENLRLEDEVLNEVTSNTQEAREEQYKGDDASSAVKQNNRALSNAIDVGSLRRRKQEEVQTAKTNRLI